jgi:hypothetical protein
LETTGKSVIKVEDTSSEYYIVSVELHEVKSLNGSILTHDGTVAWLGIRDGWQVLEGAGSAHHFKEKPTLEKIAKWDKSTWYKVMKHGTAKVYKINRTVTTIEAVEEMYYA